MGSLSCSTMELAKRARPDADAGIVAKRAKSIDDIPRTSSLQAPIMLLTGHESAVTTCRFNPNGKILATGSMDKQIFLWHVHGDCENLQVYKGHKNAVLQVDWSIDGTKLCSASAAPGQTLTCLLVLPMTAPPSCGTLVYVVVCTPSRSGTKSHRVPFLLTITWYLRAASTMLCGLGTNARTMCLLCCLDIRTLSRPSGSALTVRI